MNIYIFENEQSLDFYPISRNRATFEIYCGIFNFLDRISNFLPNAKINLIVREELIEVTKKKYPNYKINPEKLDEGIWLLGNVLWSKEDLELIINGDIGVYKHNDIIIAAKLNASLNNKLKNKLFFLETKKNNFPLINNNLNSQLICYLWELTSYNSDQIKIDAKSYKMTDKLYIQDKANNINKDKICIHNTVKFSKNTVF